MRFDAMYGRKFADMWEGSDLKSVKAVWAEDLGSFTGEEIAAGIEACKAREWPPTLPEFMKLCRPDRSEEAFRRAVVLLSKEVRDYGNDHVLYWSIQRFGAYELRQTTWDRAKQSWKDIYGKCVDENRRGMLPVIPPLRDALPPPGGIRISPEEADAILKKAGFSLNPFGDKTWAERLKARHEAGEDLSPIQIQSYKEALGMGE